MLGLIKGALTSSISLREKIMYLSSLICNHSIHPDNNNNNAVVLEAIFNQLSTPNERYIGLKVLEIALRQNFNQFYNKGKWCSVIYGIIRDAHAANLLQKQACKVLAMLIPQMANDSALSEAKDELAKEIYPVLLERIKENVEWAIEACICVKMCLKTFPSDVAFHEHLLMKTILHQASYSVSSKFMEALAECFCELPYCTKDNSVLSIQCRWNDVFKQTLKTIESLQISCLQYKKPCVETYVKADNEAEEFEFGENNAINTMFEIFCQDVRRFVNLCKCLAKLLSVQSKYSVKVPIRSTMQCLLPLYSGNKRDKHMDSNEETLYTFFLQMQLAGLLVFESLIINCNLQKNSMVIRDLIFASLENCVSPFSSQLVCELRVAVWRLLCLWLDGYGRNASKRIPEQPQIINELLKDIQIDTSESQQQINNASKSKKTTSLESGRKSIQMKESQQKNCLAALTALESLLSAGSLDLPNGIFQEICNIVFNICHTLNSTCNPFPPPYHDASCRKKLYTVVQTIVLVIKPDGFQTVQTAMKILSRISRDPSYKIRRWSNKSSIINRLLLYPKRPLPVSFENKQKRQNVSNELSKYPEWSRDEYVENPSEEKVSETLENVKIESTFQINSDEVHSEEYMDAEPHYSEQVVENQCNGEDMLEIQSSSQCQDEDDDSEEEEEEEDEERNYIEEEMNQDEVEQEMYIPPARKVMISSAVQMNSETVQSINEPEYEELAPCVKTGENSYNNSNEDKCINGEEVRNKDMPSSSVQQVVTSENGIFGVEEDDVDDEHEEEEEEDNESYAVGPPQKKQRIETIEDPDADERPQSPTMDVMKASLLEILPSEEEVKSGKVQLSATCQL